VLSGRLQKAFLFRASVPTTIMPRVAQGKMVPSADFVSTRLNIFEETVPTLIQCAGSTQTTMQAQ
jgi:hypothetical protein